MLRHHQRNLQNNNDDDDYDDDNNNNNNNTVQYMWNVKAKLIPIILVRLESCHGHLQRIKVTFLVSTAVLNCRR